MRTAWIWTADMRLKTTAPEVDRTDYGDTLVAPVASRRRDRCHASVRQHDPLDGRAVARRRVQPPVRL